jgi:hypothetical protein
VTKLKKKRRSIKFRLLGALFGAIVAAAGPGATAAAEDGTISQYALQAAYLFKFGAFVEWPASSFAAPNSPLVLCVQGNDPLGDGLEKSLEDKLIGGRPLVVHRIKTASQEAGCHILYIAAGEAKQAREILGTLRGSPVLTVTDTAAAGDQGEIIHFVISDNRVRFNIDDQAAAAGGLAISSRLLSLAVSVKARK